MIRRAGAVLLAIASVAALAAEPTHDTAAPIELRRDVLLHHLGRGASPEQACEVVLRYFGGVCYPTDATTFTLADAPLLTAAFYTVIRLER